MSILQSIRGMWRRRESLGLEVTNLRRKISELSISNEWRRNKIEQLQEAYAQLMISGPQPPPPNDTEWQKRFQELDGEYAALEKEFAEYKSESSRRWQDTIIVRQAFRDIKRSLEVLASWEK